MSFENGASATPAGLGVLKKEHSGHTYHPPSRVAAVWGPAWCLRKVILGSPRRLSQCGRRVDGEVRWPHMQPLCLQICIQESHSLGREPLRALSTQEWAATVSHSPDAFAVPPSFAKEQWRKSHICVCTRRYIVQYGKMRFSCHVLKVYRLCFLVPLLFSQFASWKQAVVVGSTYICEHKKWCL